MKVEIKYNKSTMNKLKTLPDIMVYAIARQTLDRVGSMKITPYRTGRMERSMFTHGVTKNSSGIYTIGNYTNYAEYVYAKPQRTNWTNPNSKAKWFDCFWKNYGKTVTNNVVERYKL